MSRLSLRGGVATCVMGALLCMNGCGGDDGHGGSTASTGTGGDGGTAGTGGTAGAGSGGEPSTTSTNSGSGGSAGGSTVGGSGGDGGSVATGGSGGDGGTGASGGNAVGGEGGAGEDDVIPDEGQLEILSRLSPLPDVPEDTTNAFADDPEAAELGQMFFFDAAFSGPLQIDSDLGDQGDEGMVSCASCHSSPMMSDARSQATVSIGAGIHSRNAPAVVNSSFYRWTNWGGRFSAQWELPLAVAESGVIMNGNRLALAHRIFDVYRDEYEAVFGAMEPAIGSDGARFPAAGKPGVTAWDGMNADDQVIINRVLVNFSKAISAYVRLLVSREAPFDAFMAGDSAALSNASKRGALLFIGKANCVNCHSGPHFSDGEFHALGVPQEGENVPTTDDGRYQDAIALLNSPFNRNGLYSDDTDTGGLAGVTNPMPEEMRRAFRTPALRGVALTAPYMHSGQLATLEDVIEFYDDGGGNPDSGSLVPLHLTEGEKSDLVAFLESLTGALPDADLLEDTSR